jgi:head-tail adaptor
MRYRNQVVLQSLTSLSFKGGIYTNTWNTVNTYWAAVKDESGNEIYTNRKGQELTDVKIIMRDFLVLDKQIHRFLFENKVVIIESIVDVSNRGIECVIKGRIDNVSN